MKTHFAAMVLACFTVLHAEEYRLIPPHERKDPNELRREIERWQSFGKPKVEPPPAKRLEIVITNPPPVTEGIEYDRHMAEVYEKYPAMKDEGSHLSVLFHSARKRQMKLIAPKPFTPDLILPLVTSVHNDIERKKNQKIRIVQMLEEKNRIATQEHARKMAIFDQQMRDSDKALAEYARHRQMLDIEARKYEAQVQQQQRARVQQQEQMQISQIQMLEEANRIARQQQRDIERIALEQERQQQEMIDREMYLRHKRRFDER